MATLDDRVEVCQYIIDSIAIHIPGVPTLDHITGRGVALKERRSLEDLLDIFAEWGKCVENWDSEESNVAFCNLSEPVRESLKSMSRQSISCLRKVEAFSQTTPLCRTHVGTSPIRWSDILRGNVTNPNLTGKACLIQDKSTRRPLQDIQPNKQFHEKPKFDYDFVKMATNKSVYVKAPRKVFKPKHVLSSKVRKKSTSGGCKVKTNKYDDDIDYMLKLMEDIEALREKRREIDATIKKNDSSILQSFESILCREIQKIQEKVHDCTRRKERPLTHKSKAKLTRPAFRL